MSDLKTQLHDLVVANRILAREDVVDGYGHVSIRHPDRPDRFFLSCSRSPELVTLDDIMEFDLDCNPIDQRGRAMYAERPIHGSIFRARPDVMAVIHNHSFDLIPFSITNVKLRPVVHVAGGIGGDIPVWDIRTNFGDTNLLVTTLAQGADLAETLGSGHVALMRGHGCAVTADGLKLAVQRAVYLKVNAKLQADAMRFGDISFLNDGEIARCTEMMGSDLSLNRVWEYWARRSGADAL